MEKTFKLTLTDEQKREIADALGIPIDHVGVQVAYAQAFDEDAKGNEAVIAKVNEETNDGKVWVVEQLSMLAQRPDGSSLVSGNLASVVGGLQQQKQTVLINSSKDFANRAPAALTPESPAALKGKKA